MNQAEVEARLADLPLGTIRYFDCIASTNDEAARWAQEDAADFSLVLADEQTAGKGRVGRRWFTIPGAALAFSVILHPPMEESHCLPQLTALGALAVCDALQNVYGLPAQIKWPNDVVLQRRKVAGVLAEAQWFGERLSSIVLGIGINVAPASISEDVLPPAQMLFPPGCVETALGRPVDRLELLHAVLAALLRRRQRLATPDLMADWESNLAFRGEWVQVVADLGDQNRETSSPVQEGRLIGLAADGSLELAISSGEVIAVPFGEMRLRPIYPSRG